MSQPALPPGQYSPSVNPPMDTALLRTWEQTTPDDGHRQIYQRLRRAIELSNADNAQLSDLNTLSASYEAAVVASRDDRISLHAADTAQAALITALAARVTALEARTLVGSTGQLTKNLTVGLGGSTTTFGITFAKAMPSANYIPLVSLDGSSVSLLGTTSVVYPITDKTAFGCTVTVRNSALLTIASSVTVYVAALQLT